MRFTRQFYDPLHVAFVMLILGAAALAWFYYESAKWFGENIESITTTSSVVEGYREISGLTRIEIDDLGVRLLQQDNGDSSADRQTRVAALREVVSSLEANIAHGDFSSGQNGENREVQRFREFQAITEDILRTAEEIDQALQESRWSDATIAWNMLVAADYPKTMEELIDATIEDQGRQIRLVSAATISRTDFVATKLPFIMALLVLLFLILIYLISRGMSRSVSALNEGAGAFIDGDLDYQIPELKQKEVAQVAAALNKMAMELSDSRKRLKDTTVRLESIVKERTRELTVSNKRLAELDRNRRKLLADISHEFRTPLTVIRGESDLILRGEPKAKADWKAAFVRILGQVDHAANLVDDLLFIARADAGEPRFNFGSVSVARLVDSLCDEFATKAQQKNISIERHTREGAIPVYGDEERLRQVFAILMDNALRYSRPNGRVKVTVLKEDGHLNITFRDYGIGLTEEEAEMAFERFYRGHDAQKHASGTGLGLPVAKAIVQGHNGTISMAGEPDVGATVTVKLPIADQFKGDS